MKLRTAITIAVPALFLGYFFVYPVVTILVTGLAPEGGASAFVEVLKDPTMRSVIWFTLWQAVLSTLLTFAIGMPAAYVFARYTFPGKWLFRARTLVPFVLPTLVVGSAMLALLGPTSPFGIDLRGTVAAMAGLAPDGLPVQEGDVVIRFDPSDMEKQLLDGRSDRAAAESRMT